MLLVCVESHAALLLLCEAAASHTHSMVATLGSSRRLTASNNQAA